MKTISIVISAYNEEGNISPLIEEIYSSIPNKYEYELIFVNDGSNDKTESIIQGFCKKDKRVKLINFSKNYGHEVAMSSGMDFAIGDAVIFMDSDLQHPPALINKLISKWESGNKIVLTKRINNEEKCKLYNISSSIYYKVLNYLSEFEMQANTPDFRLIDRHYINILKQFPERSRLFRGLLYIVDAKDDTTTIEFNAPQRHSGATKYSFLKLVNLAIDGILAFSVKPLRIALIFSIILLFLSIFLGIYFFFEWFIWGNDVPGFTTLILTITALGSANLFVLSVIGEYIGRIHIETKQRPLYTLKSIINIEKEL